MKGGSLEKLSRPAKYEVGLFICLDQRVKIYQVQMSELLNDIENLVDQAKQKH